MQGRGASLRSLLVEVALGEVEPLPARELHAEGARNICIGDMKASAPLGVELIWLVRRAASSRSRRSSRYPRPFGASFLISTWFFSQAPFWSERMGSQQNGRISPGRSPSRAAIPSSSENSGPLSVRTVPKTLLAASSPPGASTTSPRAALVSPQVLDASGRASWKR